MNFTLDAESLFGTRNHTAEQDDHMGETAIRILLLTDTHGAYKSEKLVYRVCHNRRPDMILHAGDVSLMNHFAEHIFTAAMRNGVPLYFVSGNHDSTKLCRKLASDYPAYWCDNRCLHAQGLNIWGISNREPSHVYSDEQPPITESNDNAVQEAPSILLTHLPPSPWTYKESDQGSPVVTRMIQDIRPRLVVTGHFHEPTTRIERVNGTPIVNPGESGAWAIFDKEYHLRITPCTHA